MIKLLRKTHRNIVNKINNIIDSVSVLQINIINGEHNNNIKFMFQHLERKYQRKLSVYIKNNVLSVIILDKRNERDIEIDIFDLINKYNCKFLSHNNLFS